MSIEVWSFSSFNTAEKYSKVPHRSPCVSFMFQVKTKSSLHPTAKVKTRVPWIPPGKVSTRETSYKWEVSQILHIHSHLCLCTIHVKYCTLCRKENHFCCFRCFHIYVYFRGHLIVWR